MKEMVGGCCVCSDERGWPDNPLVYCDGNGCTVAVHQACYGIVTVPTGPWYCRKCESPETKGKVRCELCPSRSGALKRTDTGGWAHVVCALYIPEVRFGNVTSMEPIVLRLIPPERYNKTCYICQDLGKPHRATAGACMQCNKSGCKQQFHVTCAQSLGLLCEEAGNYLDNVKYCGYCQHHYSKLFTNHEVTVVAKKKGGNVKTIPPYKPVSHDSQSSDSSGEKERDVSPMAGAAAQASGSGTPTHATKSKGPGRKSSHGNSNSGKNTPSTNKGASNTPQPMDTSEDAPDPPSVTRKHKSSGDKNKKKASPARRGSSTGDGSGSKASTPAPSPQHSSDTPQTKGSGNTTPASVAAPAPSPNAKTVETTSVISSVASAVAASVSTVPITAGPSVSSSTTSVVQTPTSKPSGFQESVITNTDSIDTKQTKKRKAAAAANAAAEFAAQAAAAAAAQHAATQQGGGDQPPPQPGPSWESQGHSSIDVQMDNNEKAIKKAKTDADGSGQGGPPPPPPPPPPPAASPAPQQPSPRVSQRVRNRRQRQKERHLASPMPGPSGMNPPSAIRSPSQHQGASAKSEREGHASILVSVPLLSTSYGLNFSPHLQVTSATVTEMAAPPAHVFHQPQKQATMESSIPGHPSHVAQRGAWGGLNVSYEMQQDPTKPGGSGVAGSSKDVNMAPMPPANIRNKKRAAMATSVVSLANIPPPPSPMQMTTSSTQSLASVRRQPQPTPPPPLYQDPKESPPSSPSSDRPLKPKSDHKIGMSCTAPHMLGNELNPSSGAAARLQEQLSAELAAHAAGSVGPDPLVPPPLINKAVPGGSGSGRSSSSAQSLDQLLERQWEQGSQFLMEQAQHFDIASLLSCLHQLRTENVRLEEHVANLLQRRDHLLAVNARLAIPLTAVGGGPPTEPPRCPRENGSQVRPPPPSVRTTETITSDRSHQLLMREVQQKPS